MASTQSEDGHARPTMASASAAGPSRPAQGEAMDEDQPGSNAGRSTSVQRPSDDAEQRLDDDEGDVDGGGRSMDLISQLESDLALMLQIMSSSMHFLANRSAHVQLNAAIPLFQPISGASLSASRNLIDSATMHENIEELTDDLVGKAKDMERLLQALPCQRNEEAVKEELRQIDGQMAEANAEYRAALQESKELREEMDVLLRHLCDDHQAGRAQLAAAATEPFSSCGTSTQAKSMQR